MSEKQLRSIFKLLLVIATVILIMYNYKPEDKPTKSNYVSNATRIHFIDVGQGDCSLIESNGEYMLIDSGEVDAYSKVKEYVDSLNIEEFKYVIATHPHSDHIGSLSRVVDNYKIDNIIMPKVSSNSSTFINLAKSIKANDVNVIESQVGENYNFGDCSFMIIAPYTYSSDEMNDNSVGIKLTHGNDKCIFMGDSGSNVEKQILDKGIDIKADLFKVSHHGSKTSNSLEFLKAMSPKYAVISCAKNNEYNHPHKPILDRLKELNVDVYRTDESGNIVFQSTGNGLKIIKGIKSGASLAPAA